MTIFHSPRFLRAVLALDALSGAGTAVLQLTLAGWLSHLLGLPALLLFASGAALWLFVAAAAWLAAHQAPPVAGVRGLALANGAWVAGCLWLLFTGAAGTLAGQAYLVIQAVAVGVLAELQWMGARRKAVAAWA